ncbi:MAG: hypothetical protein PHQ86_08080 [Dehalococcoidales bacterium]|nr:hypothetical protein [Dehalococcoidales bacterium]
MSKISNPGNDTENIIYYANDCLGNTVTTTDAKGDVVNQNQYDAWGAPQSVYKREGRTDDNYVYTGKIYDKSTRSYNLGKRIYMPEMKRFLTDDAYSPTLDNLKTYNPYVYANNDPVNYWDPDGNDAILLNDSDAVNLVLFKAGHNASLVGDDIRGWYYFSKDGIKFNNLFTSGDNISFNSIYKFNNLNDFLASDISKRYDRMFMVQTSLSQDVKMIDYANQSYIRDYSVKGLFDRNGTIYSENCADLVYDIFSYGGLNISKPTLFGTIPNFQFSDFIKNNEGEFIYPNTNQ